MSDRAWRVRPYREGDEHDILAFFNAVFSEGNPGFVPRTLEHWHWQFRDNPFGHRHFVAETLDGRVIGNYAGIRTPFLWAGENRVGCQAVDVCVHRDHRRLQLFVALGGAFIERYGTPDRDFVMFGYPNEKGAAGVRFLRYGPVHCPVHKLVYDLSSPGDDEVRARAEGLEAAAVPLDERVETLWSEVAREHVFTTRRELGYLRWRYGAHPEVRYETLAVERNGRLEGMAIVRFGWLGQPVAAIVDWIVPRRASAVMAALAGAVVERARELGGRRVETWVPPLCPERDALHALGFSAEPTQFHLMLKVYEPRLDFDWAAERWFYTMGDTDFY